MRVPPGSTVRRERRDNDFWPKRGVRVPIFVLRVGVRVSFGGETPAEQLPVSVPVRARGRLRRRLRGVFRGPLDRGERERTGHRLPLLSSLPWGGGAKRAPTLPPWFRYREDGRRTRPRTYPLFSPPWGGAPTVPEVHLGPEKAAIPFSTFPIVGDIPVHPPAYGPPAPAAVWIPCGALGRYPRDSRPPLGPLSDSQGGFLGCPKYIPRSRPALFPSEAAVGPQDHEGRIRPAASLRVVLPKQRVVMPGCTITGDESSNGAEAEPAYQ